MHYTWRTVGDDKVRDAHAELAGLVVAASKWPSWNRAQLPLLGGTLFR